MAHKPILSVIEKTQISPSPAIVHDRSLPLTFFDIFWLQKQPINSLFFYDFPNHSKSHFVETVIPKLKHSLSLTLQHFFPVAGNLIIFPNSTTKPEMRYADGDSVALTFAESSLDFNDLVGNHPRDCDKFYPLVPVLGTATILSDYVKVPVFSVQVTLFPNSGFCIGTTNHHCLGDGSSRFCFMKAWASFARSGTNESFPVYDRVINHPKLDELYLRKHNLKTYDYQLSYLVGTNDKARATFVLTRPVISRLKKQVLAQSPDLEYVSAFTVACAYIWTCRAKTRNDESEMFIFAVDCRSRLDPPIPANYFGNCVTGSATKAETSVLTGKEGFVTAAKLIREVIHKIVGRKDGVIAYAEALLAFDITKMPTTVISVSGTPKLKFYEMDFGWGRPRKCETVSIDYNDAFSLNTSRDSEDDIEVGVSLSRDEMAVFVRFFDEGLKEYGF